MKKLTKAQSTKLAQLRAFITYLEESGQGAAYLSDNDVTYGWSLYNIYQNAAGVCITVDHHRTGAKKTERIEPTQINQIWSAVRKGEDYFTTFNNTHI